jgi:hypothetical protein
MFMFTLLFGLFNIRIWAEFLMFRPYILLSFSRSMWMTCVHTYIAFGQTNKWEKDGSSCPLWANRGHGHCWPGTGIRTHSFPLGLFAKYLYSVTWLVTGLTEHLQIVTTNNYNSFTVLQISKDHYNYNAHKVFSVFTSRCLVAASNGGRSPSSGFPNSLQPQIPASHFS